VGFGSAALGMLIENEGRKIPGIYVHDKLEHQHHANLVEVKQTISYSKRITPQRMPYSLR